MDVRMQAWSLILTELQHQARAEGEDVLAYLLAMAAEEARCVQHRPTMEPPPKKGLVGAGPRNRASAWRARSTPSSSSGR